MWLFILFLWLKYICLFFLIIDVKFNRKILILKSSYKLNVIKYWNFLKSKIKFLSVDIECLFVIKYWYVVYN